MDMFNKMGSMMSKVGKVIGDVAEKAGESFDDYVFPRCERKEVGKIR